MNEYDALRLKIMQLREEKGFSQSAFAEKLGLSRSHMNKLENGTLQISIPYLKQISRVLETPITALLEDEIMSQNKESQPFDYEGVNRSILDNEESEDWTLSCSDLLVTQNKLDTWKMNAKAGSIIIGASACRYLIIITKTKPHLEGNGLVLPSYGFVNIDHAGWELCEPVFDSTDELVEWFASNYENPVVDVLSNDLTERSLPAQEWV